MTKTTIPLTSHPHHAATPTAMLVQEHEVILRGLTALEKFGWRLESGQPVDREALAWLIDFFRTFADRCHHGKEEQHLFPALERHGLPKEVGPLAVMREEHEEGRALVRGMAEGNDRQIAAAIRGYAALLRAHIDKENTVLFPLAEQILPDEEQRDLLHAFEAVEQAVAGPGVHGRLLAGLARLEGS
jgi:hemerythrin-like domain-containing protein